MYKNSDCPRGWKLKQQSASLNLLGNALHRLRRFALHLSILFSNKSRYSFRTGSSEVYGVGTDIIEVERIAAAIKKNGAFQKRVYTQSEVEYCENKVESKYPSYAARFAAKEAVAKSLSEGVGKNVSLKEIELSNTDRGAPYIILHGGTLEYSRKMGIKEIKISVSSTENFAVAYAISFTE